jgi:hypothetical protein
MNILLKHQKALNCGGTLFHKMKRTAGNSSDGSFHNNMIYIDPIKGSYPLFYSFKA